MGFPMNTFTLGELKYEDAINECSWDNIYFGKIITEKCFKLNTLVISV